MDRVGKLLVAGDLELVCRIQVDMVCRQGGRGIPREHLDSLAATPLAGAETINRPTGAGAMKSSMRNRARAARRPTFGSRRARPAAFARSVSIFIGFLGLTGCAYLETQMHRPAVPDTRAQLGAHDHVSLYARELPDYTCLGGAVLKCERGGAVTYSCACVGP